MKKTGILLALLLVLGITVIGIPVRSSQASTNTDQTVSVNQMVQAAGKTSFHLLIRNEDNQLHNYKLAYDLMPQGMQGKFVQQQKDVEKVAIEPLASLLVEARISVSESTTVGNHQIIVKVDRDDGQVSFTPLSLTINRDYALSISNEIQNLSGINGQNLSFQIAVANTGKLPMNQVGIKLDLPYKWMVQGVNPGKMSLKPGENGLFTIQLAVPASQTAGNFQLKTTGISGHISSPVKVIPVTIQSNHNYLFWVIALLVLAAISTLLYFRKHGRR